MNDVISVFSLAINGATVPISPSDATILNIALNSLLSSFVSSRTRFAENPVLNVVLSSHEFNMIDLSCVVFFTASKHVNDSSSVVLVPG